MKCGTVGSNNGFLLYPGGSSTTYSVAGSSYKSFSMIVGSDFGITPSGKLHASGAEISGKITATSGDIGGFMISYYEIGQRVRKFRKAYGLSQEELAEKVGISTTHMSHIETGNTKLSLQVLVDLALALEVKTDDLLFDDTPSDKSDCAAEIARLIDSCSAVEAKLLKEIIFSIKTSIDKYL